MAYITPRFLIEQEFLQVPVFSDQPLSAFVFGPQYNLYRYGTSSEKASTAVVHPLDSSLSNFYQANSDVEYEFPSQVSGTKVDADYVKVYFEDAEAEYFPNDLASTSAAVVRVQNTTTSKYYPNRIKASALVFKTANSVDRTADFSERDVKPGDIIHLSSATAAAASATATFEGKVKAIHASKTTASVSSTVTSDTDNTATQATDINDAVVSGVDNQATGTIVVANETTSFEGGYVNGVWIGEETFTATVITEGNLSGVRFDISSTHNLAGTEDRTNVALGSASPLTDIDEIALFVDPLDPANIVKLDFTGSTTPVFKVGDTYSVTVRAAVVAPTVTAGGTYTGSKDLVYKLTVVRAGEFYDGSTNSDTCCRIAVTSNDVDSSATVNVRASTAFNVGSYGATATFTAGTTPSGLIEGDIYYVSATAAVDGASNIIETYETLPAGLTAGTYTDWLVSSLRLVKDYEVSDLIPGNFSDVNWEVDTTNQTITINSGITTTDSTVLDSGGNDPRNLDVLKAKVFVEHRDLVLDNSTSIGSVTSTDQVEDSLGLVHPDNPLAQGVYDAVLNSAGVTVYYCGIASDDLAGYNDALALAKKSRNYYSLVPLTFDRTVQDAVVGHVNAMSTAEYAKWRIAWFSVEKKESELLYDTDDDGDNYTATITDDPLSTGTNYTLVTVAGAQFVTDGIRAGDKVLIGFRIDANGEQINDEYTVAEARTETTLALVEGPAAAINVAEKAQIKRIYTKDEQVETLAQVGSDFNNRRVRTVFPDTTKNGDTVKPGYFLAAALAGLRSGVVPHQGLTNSELLGFTDLSDTVTGFTEDQLNVLADEGYFIATQDAVGATPYVRHQLTTDASGLSFSEDSATTNVDSISFGLQDVLDPFIGTHNVNATNIATIRDTIMGQLNFRQVGTFTARAGNQLNGYTIKSLKQSATFKDRIEGEIQLDIPYPLNYGNLKLIV